MDGINPTLTMTFDETIRVSTVGPSDGAIFTLALTYESGASQAKNVTGFARFSSQVATPPVEALR
jgi:hypothetical protein